ncbi:uncharacterized protein LOC114318687 [Camellia sinensis]|uniref:uncharacterized protein LOC114318687 n=1 Tax=Camellia sinensis TaxID=4442 RepID=UPI0010367AFE|nr:uncharacterized protein LOC114318687 [Camellia sinensis]
MEDEDNNSSETGIPLLILELGHPIPSIATNWQSYANLVEIGVSSIDLSDNEDTKSNEEDDDKRMREVTDSAIRRAFREDESRRNALLTAETATRVMKAMRGVSFGGFAPDWANRVLEDQWINQIRRLRPPETTIHQN